MTTDTELKDRNPGEIRSGGAQRSGGREGCELLFGLQLLWNRRDHVKLVQRRGTRRFAGSERLPPPWDAATPPR